jgi:hypothetical protein
MVTTDTSRNRALAEQWRYALASLEVKHPDRRSTAVVTVSDDPATLFVGLDKAWSTTDDKPIQREPFAVSSVMLTFFPGTKLAREWFVVAWAGYIQHEAFELVRMTCHEYCPIDEDHPSYPVLNPHAEPYPTNPWNRGLRDGLPPILTPETMLTTFELVLPPREARIYLAQQNAEIAWP